MPFSIFYRPIFHFPPPISHAWAWLIPVVDASSALIPFLFLPLSRLPAGDPKFCYLDFHFPLYWVHFRGGHGSYSPARASVTKEIRAFQQPSVKKIWLPSKCKLHDGYCISKRCFLNVGNILRIWINTDDCFYFCWLFPM
jgi:hypothetical protein